MAVKSPQELMDILARCYGEPSCALHYNTPFELLVAVILSAQCTDKRVNIVTASLFKEHNTPKAFANMQESVLQEYIKTCGFFRAKAKSIISAAKDIVERFDGNVPDTLEGLQSLRGVGIKTASVMMSEVFKVQSIAVDTHVFRVSRRLGIASGNTPEKVMKELMACLDPSRYTESHHLMIFHGRNTCKAINPNCTDCVLKDYCPTFKKDGLDKRS